MKGPVVTGPVVRGPGAAIRLDRIRKTFGDTVVVPELTLEVPAGSMTALLGPSGGGKSTTLSMIAGLTQPDDGDISIGGQSVLGLAAERRPLSLVFQKPLLFPHLSVAANVGFGLRMRRVPRAQVARQVEIMLERVQLGGLGQRRPGQLSGGQEQRAALARALVLSPPVLLLDEPFSQLDATLRVEMRQLVRQLHDESGFTSLFVTHDQAEAVAVADRIALLVDGRLAGVGTPEDFFRRPPSLAAARFFGVGNELAGMVTGGCFRSRWGMAVPAHGQPDGPATLVVRPESVRLVDPATAGAWPTLVIGARFAGSHLAVTMLPGGAEPSGEMVAHLRPDEPVAVGSTIGLHLPAGSCTIFPAAAFGP